MKTYIKDFCYDLNYKNIVLYIGFLDKDEIQLLKKCCNDNYVNKEYRWEYIENGTNLFYIENCDLQDCNGYELNNCIIDEYKFYVLEHDKDGFYYKQKIIFKKSKGE